MKNAETVHQVAMSPQHAADITKHWRSPLRCCQRRMYKANEQLLRSPTSAWCQELLSFLCATVISLTYSVLLRRVTVVQVTAYQNLNKCFGCFQLAQTRQQDATAEAGNMQHNNEWIGWGVRVTNWLTLGVTKISMSIVSTISTNKFTQH